MGRFEFSHGLGRKRPELNEQGRRDWAAFLFRVSFSRSYTSHGDAVTHARKLIGSNPARGGAVRTREINNLEWLPFVDVYRTFCIVPSPEVKAVFDGVRRFSARSSVV